MATQGKSKISKKVLEQKRASIEAAIKKKRECEKKALEIVEYLIDNRVTSSNWLVENSKFINPQYYDDVTEERSIIKICGFPLCANALTKVENKKFAISTKTNKVYDITERKKFCSDKCFSSSKIFKDQLPSSPLWMRDEEKFGEIEIPSTLKPVPGDEILITSIVLPDDEKEDEITAKREEIEARKREQKKKEIQERETAPKPHPCDVVFKSLRQWFCSKTLNWIENFGDVSDDEEVDELKERLNELSVNKSCKEDHPPSKYKSALSYEHLKRDGNHAALKVRAFFSGKWEYACDDEEQLATVKEEEANEADPDAVEVPIVMPLANLSAQRALRRKVVLDYLEKWLLGLSTSTNLKFRQYQHDLHEIVFTFNLTADTITFRPDEIPVLGIAALIILGRRNAIVKENLIDPQMQEKIAKILRPYDHTLSDMEDFLDDLIENCKKVDSR